MRAISQVRGTSTSWLGVETNDVILSAMADLDRACAAWTAYVAQSDSRARGGASTGVSPRASLDGGGGGGGGAAARIQHHAGAVSDGLGFGAPRRATHAVGRDVRARTAKVFDDARDHAAHDAWFAAVDRCVAKVDGGGLISVTSGDGTADAASTMTAAANHSRGYFAVVCLSAYAAWRAPQLACARVAARAAADVHMTEASDDEDEDARKRRSDDAFIERATCVCERGDFGALRGDVHALAVMCRVLSELSCRRSAGDWDAFERVAEALKRVADAVRGDNIDALTPQHACYLRVCLKGKMYSEMMSSGLFDAPRVYEVNTSATGADATDFLLYCYYAGRAYMSLRRYDDAVRVLLDAICAPAMTVSAIVVASYKKYVLASLMTSKARVAPLPKYASSPVKRYVAVAKEFDGYTEIASAFDKCDAVALERAIENHAEAYAKDGNSALVASLRHAWRRAKVRRLARTYVTLSLRDIAEYVALPTENTNDAEALVFRMIKSGDVSASIDGVDRMVRFHETTASRDDGVAAKLHERLIVAAELDARVRKENEMIAKDAQYVEAVVRAEHQKHKAVSMDTT